MFGKLDSSVGLVLIPYRVGFCMLYQFGICLRLHQETSDGRWKSTMSGMSLCVSKMSIVLGICCYRMSGNLLLVSGISDGISICKLG